MAVSTLTINSDDDGGNNNSTEKKIVLTGGCVSEKGNEFLGEYFACLEITDMVRFLLCMLFVCLFVSSVES